MKKRLFPFATSLLLGLGCVFSSYGQVNVVTKAGDGGSITEAEGVCTVTPNENYRIHTVFINDSVVCGSIAPMGAETTFTLTEPGDYTVTATFLPVSEVDVWDGSTVSESLQGSGTAADPYQINSCADWVFLSEQPELFMGRNEFILNKHLDFNNQTTPPVGRKGKMDSKDYNEPFVGFFNGNNKTFINVKIDLSNRGGYKTVQCGVFGSIRGDASARYNSVVCNLGVVSGKIGYNVRNGYGGIVGSIEESVSSDFLDGQSYSFAGSVFNCYNHADIEPSDAMDGGIVGRNLTSKYLNNEVMLANCYNRGSTTSGIANSTGGEYPYYSVYNSANINMEKPKSSKLVLTSSATVLMNAYYDSLYTGGVISPNSLAKNTEGMRTQEMADLLNAGQGAPFYHQKAWIIDPEGIINAGKPYLNKAYRVYSTNDEKIFAAAPGYHPFLAYEGDSYKFRALVAGTIQVNGTTLEPDAEGYYTVNNIDKNIVISCSNATPTDISVWDGLAMDSIPEDAAAGTPADPYEISNAAQFVWFAMKMNNENRHPRNTASYKLTADIDFNGFYHPFIGAQGEISFSGTFDGNGHKLYNLRIEPGRYNSVNPNRASSNVGLFCSITGIDGQPDCVVKNITIVSGRIEGNKTLGGLTAICASAGSTKVIIANNAVKDVFTFTSVKDDTKYGPSVGLIAGQVKHNNCELRNNYATGRYLYPLFTENGGTSGAPKTHKSGALIGTLENSCKPTLKNNYAIFYDATDALFSNSEINKSSANNYYLGTNPTYGKSEEELKSAAMIDSLNNGQRKVWTRNDNVNDGFPFFNKTYAVSLPTIENGTFEPVEFCEADVTYEGDAYMFKVAPADSLKLSVDFKVLVNGTEVKANEEGVYVVENVQADLTITYEGTLVIKTFVPQLIFNEEQGTVTPSTTEPIVYGEDITFTITPATGYETDSVFVNGENVDIDENSLTVADVIDELTVEVTFKKQTFDIVLLASAGGTIELAEGSANPVTYGESATFNFVPDEGYRVAQVKVDGENLGALESYTFKKVKAVHTLEVEFEADPSGIADLYNETVSLLYREGVLTINSQGTKGTIDIFSADGTQVKRLTVNGEGTIRTYLPLSAGVYIVRFKNTQGENTGKFVAY